MKKTYKLFIAGLMICMTIQAGAQEVQLDSAGRPHDYVQTILTRSSKIVDALDMKDKDVRANVLNIVCNRYFLINDIEQKYTDETARQAELYKRHFAFAADLANYLTDNQITAVKDGMTYGVVERTYGAYLEKYPTLRDNEKRRIRTWLEEARELAIDAGSAKAKHAWFGKYKGRINNWLSKRGYK